LDHVFDLSVRRYWFPLPPGGIEQGVMWLSPGGQVVRSLSGVGLGLPVWFLHSLGCTFHVGLRVVRHAIQHDRGFRFYLGQRPPDNAVGLLQGGADMPDAFKMLRVRRHVSSLSLSAYLLAKNWQRYSTITKNLRPHAWHAVRLDTLPSPWSLLRSVRRSALPHTGQRGRSM
jgi:hypothetical protein